MKQSAMPSNLEHRSETRWATYVQKDTEAPDLEDSEFRNEPS